VASNRTENRHFLTISYGNKKAVLSQGNRSMPLSFNLMLPETRITALHLCDDSMGLSNSSKCSWWAPKTHVLCNRELNGISMSSKVVDFDTNRKRLCNFLLVINSNLGPIIPRFRDIIQLYSPQMVDKEKKKEKGKQYVKKLDYDLTKHTEIT